MTISNSITKKIKFIINFFLLLMQLIMLAAYIGIINSKDSLQEISATIFPNSNVLMNSKFLEFILSLPVLCSLAIVFIISVVKEFIYEDKNKKIIFNTTLFLIMSCLFGIVAYFLFIPIINR